MSAPAPLAYQYLRYSDDSQADGDSVRRQNEARDSWLREHPHVRLDTSMKFEDRGVSAFRDKLLSDPNSGLSDFFSKVHTGRICKGSYLLVENLDRLSRQGGLKALNTLIDL